MAKYIIVFVVAFILGFTAHFLMVGRYKYSGDYDTSRVDKWTGELERHTKQGWIPWVAE
jgi:hypothetical protein